jgi:predicted DNA-binding protein
MVSRCKRGSLTAVRTTVDLPDELHARLTSLSRDRGTTLSRTLADLVRAGLGGTVTPS